MSVLDLAGIREIQEAINCPVPERYNITCVGCKEHEKDLNGTKTVTSWRMIYAIESQDGNEYANVFDYMALPNSEDDADQIKFKMIMIKRKMFYMGLEEAMENESLEEEDFVGASSVMEIPISKVDPSAENNNREGRNIDWPNLPTEEE